MSIPPLMATAIRVQSVTWPASGFSGFSGNLTLGPQTVGAYTNEAVINLSTNSATYYTNTTYDVRFPTLLTRRAGTNVVDSVDPCTVRVQCNLPQTPPASGSSVSNGQEFTSLECIDPRFNWVLTNADFWVISSTTNSLGTTNRATLAYLTNAVNGTDYELGDSLNKATMMYCANREPLETVGELGYLCYAPWRTVRLVKGSGALKPVHSVVDTFSLVPPGTTRGLVNPNTAHRKPLQAVFNSMPVDLYPADPGATNVTAANAGSLADAMITSTYGVPSASAPFSTNGLVDGLLNVSMVGGLTNLFPSSPALSAIGVQSEFEREAVIRNSAGLFNTRNTGFTAILAASDEIGSPSAGNFSIRASSRMGAEHKAVSVVWRDPWTREQFVRFFRYLPNDGALGNY